MAKKQLIPDSVWSVYKKVINDFVEVDAGKQPILWRKYVNQPLPFGEDSGQQYMDITIDVLVGYNSYRTWPINKGTTTGELDNQNMAIYISARVLSEIGQLTPEGYMDFDRANDRFKIQGITYKSSGDTMVSQAKDEALLFMVVLKREEEDGKG